METYSLREIIKDTAMKHSEEITGTGLIFRVTVDEDVPDLYYGNYTHLVDILNYMISTSIMHTTEGKITVWVEVDSVDSETEKVDLSFDFVDSGKGLDIHEKLQVMEYFDASEQVNIDTCYGLGTNVKVCLSLRAASIGHTEEYVYYAAPKPAKKSLISVKEGLQYTGDDMGIYLVTLSEYVREWNLKKRDIEMKFEFGDWPEYRILVHALKSASYTIGAKEFGDEAKKLEFAARDLNSEFIFNNHIRLMDNLDILFEDARIILREHDLEVEEMS